MKLVVALLFCLLAQAVAAQDRMRLAVTTSFQNSGLADVLLPAAESDLGLRVDLLVVGTGQALRLGRAGDVDALLVHSRAAEDAFVAEGHAPYRRDVMYNDFVIVGPKDDPATVVTAGSATEALTRIAASRVPFVSRGDDSGTHRKELGLWADPPKGGWYREVGSGMGAALNIAAGMGAYVLTDRASWLNFGNKADLVVLFEGHPALFNQYGYLPVSAERHSHVAQEAAAKFEDWLTSARAATLINSYQIDGQQLFTFNGG